MSKYKIEVFYSREDGGYIANVPDLKYCSAFGKTREEAIHQIQIAQKAWLEAARANRKPISAPKYHAPKTPRASSGGQVSKSGYAFEVGFEVTLFATSQTKGHTGPELSLGRSFLNPSEP